MAEVVPAFTPVNLLTGFLGSGKTTLLRRLLADPALSGTAVLINEFGEAGLDHHLIERIDETVVLLRSGCLCCTIRGELATSIRDLHSRREYRSGRSVPDPLHTQGRSGASPSLSGGSGDHDGRRGERGIANREI